MDKCSYFIANKAIFGSYPSQETVNELESIGVKHFVDLTCKFEEKISPYTTTQTYIHYPIHDRRIPTNWYTFCRLVVKLCMIINSYSEGERMYVHCKGGHGRSGVLVAAILCHMFNLSPEEALERTNTYHNNREIMRDKWRKIGSPQTKMQKSFIHKLFNVLHLHSTHHKGYTWGFSVFSPHTVTIKNVGVFPTAEAALQAHKNPSDKEHTSKQMQAKTPSISKTLGRRVQLRSDWFDVRDNIMRQILYLKFEQHPELKEQLISTGFCKIIDNTNYDHYWGYINGEGKNMYGKLLEELRLKYYTSAETTNSI